MSTTITDGTIHVFAYKDGLLSRFGHDLRLRLGRFEIRVDDLAITATFWPESLEVEGAMRDGALAPGELSDRDRREILDNLRRKVLRTDRHREARFEGRARPLGEGRFEVTGQLTLAGRGAPLALEAASDGERLTGRVTLVPSRWGIAPFKALMGALRVQDRVEVAFDLPAAGAVPA